VVLTDGERLQCRRDVVTPRLEFPTDIDISRRLKQDTTSLILCRARGANAVCLSVDQSVTLLRCRKTAERIEDLFGVVPPGYPRHVVLVGRGEG